MRGTLLVVCALAAVGCGGASSQSNVASAPGPAPAPAPAPASTPAPAAASAPASASPDAAYDDPGEAHDPATLTPLFDAKAKPSFPKATADEHACWQTISVSGDAQKDFDALVAACGGPTGSIEYVKPSAGKLHETKDKRDTYVVNIRGGYCYRFFGVADATIKDLDILIERTNGDLVGEDRTNGPIAIIDSDKAWCIDQGGDYQFGVKIDGAGRGHYIFGVWARPNKKK